MRGRSTTKTNGGRITVSQVGVLRIHLAVHRDDPVLDSDVWRMFGCL